MSENKEEILANFQSITGIDDVGEAFSHLEDTNWDLVAAIQRVIPQDNDSDDPPPPPPPPSLQLSSIRSQGETSLAYNFNTVGTSTTSGLNNFSSSTSTASCAHWLKNGRNIKSSTADDSAFVPVRHSSPDDDIIDLVSDTNLEGNISSPSSSSALNSNNKHILFNIHYDQQVYDMRLPNNATIEQLKQKIFETTGVPICRQAIRGWPPAKLHEAQISTTKLSNLGLSNENELILIDLTEEGYMDYENEEVTGRLDKVFKLTIVQAPDGTRHELNFNGRTTVQGVKTNVYYVTDIPVRYQEWTGWPQGCTNDTTLAESGIQLKHHFLLKNSNNKLSNNTTNNSLTTNSIATSTITTSSSSTADISTARRPSNIMGLDTDSSTDEFEDASDFNNCEEFFSDPPPMQSASRHLISNNANDEAAGSLEFIDNYKQRFGEPHPMFFSGSLEDALKEACHKPARERKLFAIYLHHGESILTNVFCDHLLKHESILQILAENFIVYGWDLTYESNKHLLLSSVTACIGNTASLTVRSISIDKLPSILIIGKSRLSGRTSCEVLSVIHGNVGLDDLLSRLLECFEMYNEQLQVEIAEEDARALRDQVKAEQDIAYQQTLQADMAKEAAKRQKEAAQAAERQRLASERAEEEARRESIRLIAEQSLPKEPIDSTENVTKIRIRKPTGEFMERKFYGDNTLQDLLNFAASLGYLIEDYKLISSWPRRDLTTLNTTETLKTLKLYPQETVILEER